MKQAIMVKPGVIEIRDVDAPSVGAGEVLLRVRRIGVCGSDIHVWHGTHPFTGYPVVQGHEFSAEVEAVGTGVEGISPGDKVTALPQVVCGACAPCKRGDYHICDVLKVEGFQAPGCAQEFFVTSAAKTVTLPDGFTFEEGALVEPAAVAVHAVTRATELDGKNVAVLGAGPIGNLVAQVANARGADVVITDLSDYRLDVARTCGIQRTLNAQAESLDAGAFDVAFECVGVEDTLSAAVDAVGKGGTIVVVGVFGETPRVDVGRVQDRELTLRGTLMYQRDDYTEAVRLIAERHIATDPLDSTHFPLDDYAAAYAFIDANREKTMKVFIDL